MPSRQNPQREIKAQKTKLKARIFGYEPNGNRPSPESLLAKLDQGEQAKLRVYIGAAPGVGKTYQMLEDAQLLKKQGADIVVAVVETHGREDTWAMIGDLERVPPRRIEYRCHPRRDGSGGRDRSPSSHRRSWTNWRTRMFPARTNGKRYQDVLDLLDAGISVITAVNIQHLRIAERCGHSYYRSAGARNHSRLLPAPG